MPKTAKKNAAKKRGRKPGTGNKLKLPKGYAVAELANPLGDAFEIETNPPPLGRADKYAGSIFIDRVTATIPKLKPGQAFVLHDAHSHSWMRKLLSREFPEHIFIVTPVKDVEHGVRIYLKR
jgi:hypothetical protein